MPPGHLLQTSLPRGGSSSPGRTTAAGHDGYGYGSGYVSLGLGCYFRLDFGILSSKKKKDSTRQRRLEDGFDSRRGKTDTRCAEITSTCDDVPIEISSGIIPLYINPRAASDGSDPWLAFGRSCLRPDPQTMTGASPKNRKRHMQNSGCQL